MSTDTTEKGLEAHISQYLHDENKYALYPHNIEVFVQEAGDNLQYLRF